MSGDFQDRKDIDKLYYDLYKTDGKTAKAVLFDENTSFEEDGELKTIDKIMDDYYDKGGVDDKVLSIINMIYPVGSIYMSVNDVDPALLFGGTWQKIEDTFLLASGTKYPLTVTEDNVVKRNTGGEATHTLTVDEMPSHTHVQNPHVHTQYGAYSEGAGNETAYTMSSNRSRQYVTTVERTATNQDTGGGKAHNNMPPYLVVNVWERTS